MYFVTGYEIHGLEKIPDEGPALIVYYHGAIPIDYYYFLARVIIQKGRPCHSVADHFLFKVPGKNKFHAGKLSDQSASFCPWQSHYSAPLFLVIHLIFGQKMSFNFIYH